MSDYSRIAYEFYKRNKICTQCHKQKTNGKRNVCDMCAKKNSIRWKRWNEKNAKIKICKPKKPMKICYKCGAEMSHQNTLCDKCYEKVVIPECFRRKI